MVVDLSSHHACRKGNKFFSKSSTQYYTFADDNQTLCTFHYKCTSFSVPLLVPVNWYWSFIRVVLEFQLTETAVTLMWY